MRPPEPVESTKAPPPRKLETPPTNTILVFGDSLADWLAYGLEEAYADTPEIGIVRKIRPAIGLVRSEPRSDTPEWIQAVKDALATEKPNAIVVMLGVNDRLPLRDRSGGYPGSNQDQGASPQAPADSERLDTDLPSITAKEGKRPGPGGAYEFHTDKWAELYSKRIDDMIAALKSKGVPVLWVGLPAVRGTRSTSDMSYLDELYRARAEKAGIVYVDIWDGFVDEQGRYTVQGPDFEGQIRRLRTGDGVHFTKVGAVKLAHYVEHELNRVMSNRIAPVALPSPEATVKPGVGGPRPVVGPVLPLTASESGESADLAGSGSNHAAPPASDPIATQVLSRGDPIPAPPGRADNFTWPHPDANASGTPNAPLQPSPAASPAAPPKGAAGRNDAKNPVGDKTEAKGKGTSASTAPTSKESNAVLDGGPVSTAGGR